MQGRCAMPRGNSLLVMVFILFFFFFQVTLYFTIPNQPPTSNKQTQIPNNQNHNQNQNQNQLQHNHDEQRTGQGGAASGAGRSEEVKGGRAKAGNRTRLAELTGSSFPVQHDVQADRLPGRAAKMCVNCFWHTLQTTTKLIPKTDKPTTKDYIDGGTFVFTGDIDDLWVRDSSAQVHPYIPLTSSNPLLRTVVEGLIERLSFYINFDPYANAYRVDTSYKFSARQNQLGRHHYISTWNYELDSGCYFLRLLHVFYRTVPTSPVFANPMVKEAAEVMLRLWRTEQRHEEDRALEGYFNEAVQSALFRYEELPRNGKGSPVGFTGMTWTGFRPSDDECVYGYLLPANMFAVVALGYLKEIALEAWKDVKLAESADALATEINNGILEYGIVEHETFGKIYAYEVDGLGNSLLMDDANVPSLMSIPYLGWDYDETIYLNTRRFILSKENPTYAQNAQGTIRGYGSPHTQHISNDIWPMAQLMQGLTSADVEEKLDILEQILATDDNTGWMHESYDANNPHRFTRSWFCWADALFAEFYLSLTKSEQCPGTMPQVPL